MISRTFKNACDKKHQIITAAFQKYSSFTLTHTFTSSLCAAFNFGQSLSRSFSERKKFCLGKNLQKKNNKKILKNNAIKSARNSNWIKALPKKSTKKYQKSKKSKKVSKKFIKKKLKIWKHQKNTYQKNLSTIIVQKKKNEKKKLKPKIII